MSTNPTWYVAGAAAILLLGGTVAKKAVYGLSGEAAKLGALLPEVRAALERLRARLLELGVKTFVGQTLRSSDYQATRVAAGVSSTNNSWHLAFPDPRGGPPGARAIDLYPIDPATGQPDTKGQRLELFQLLHREAPRFGFRGLAFNADGSKRYITVTKDGKKVPIWDAAHIEFTGGMTFAQAQAVKPAGRVA